MRLLLKSLPDVLTLTRLVCAFGFVWAVHVRDWDAAFWIMVVGAYTDPLDGKIARAVGLPQKRWYGMTGKTFNEVASGALAVLPPVALMVFPLWDAQQPQSFGLWVVLCVFFGLMTLSFIRSRNPEYEPNVVRRERNAIYQGWFTGFIWVCCGAQAFYLSNFSGSLISWFVPLVLMMVAILMSHERWNARPEVTA